MAVLEEEVEREAETLTNPWQNVTIVINVGTFNMNVHGKRKGENFIEAGEEILLMAYVEDTKVNREELWYLDSGCSNHMCGKKE